ncbi:MAG: LytR/AlgR family response regulator transcription factor [Hyphomonadaceae bacterium]
MSTLRALIVDDEPWAVQRLEVALRATPDVEVIGAAYDGAEACAKIIALKPDLVLLDIKMPEADGFEVIRRLDASDMPEFVFVTAFDEHAPKAFEVDATDYLLKPVDEERLQRALERIRARLNRRNAEERAVELERVLTAVRNERRNGATPRYERDFWLRQGERTLRISADQVDWFEAERDYVVLHIGQRTMVMRESLTQMQRRLDPERFIRIHRACLVQIDRIRDVKRIKGRVRSLTLRNGTTLDVGVTYAPHVSKLLRHSE